MDSSGRTMVVLMFTFTSDEVRRVLVSAAAIRCAST